MLSRIKSFLICPRQWCRGYRIAGLDTVLERPVASKELFDKLAHDKKHAERFNVEAKILASLNHSNVLLIYDFLQENGSYRIADFGIKPGNKR